MMDRLLRESNPPTGQLASPKPQYKKPGEDTYEPVEGQYGAPFTILKNASGQVISPATDTQLEQVRALLQALTGKDYAKDATLALIIAALDSIQTEVAATKAAVQSANAMKLFGASLSDRPPAGSVPVGTTFTLPNEDLDTWISDGTRWVVV